MEEWRKCPDPIAKYEVSSTGRVRNTNTGRILKHDVTKSNYLYFNLTLDTGKQQKYYAHKLEGQCFLPNPDNLPSVDHINQNKHDNRLENLRWATHSQQMVNRTIVKDRYYGRAVHQVDSVTGAVLKTWKTCAQACLAVGINPKNLAKIIQDAKVAAGYLWLYADEHTATEQQVWKQLDMKTYRPVYVSECGLVKVQYKSGRFRLVKAIRGGGYLRLSLPMMNKEKRKNRLFYVHRLVALVHLPLRSKEKVVVNHINGDKLDNRAENLEWTTYKLNSAHAVANSLITVCRPVDQLSLQGEYIQSFSSVMNAARAFGLKSSSGIQCALSGKYLKSSGFKWRYSSSV